MGTTGSIQMHFIQQSAGHHGDLTEFQNLGSQQGPDFLMRIGLWCFLQKTLKKKISLTFADKKVTMGEEN